jgi:hypothetical protein
MCGESSVNRSSRLTKLRVTPSRRPVPLPTDTSPSPTSASTGALAPAPGSASSGRGFTGAQASPRSGAMITFRPPRRFQLIGVRTVIVRPFWPRLASHLSACGPSYKTCGPSYKIRTYQHCKNALCDRPLPLFSLPNCTTQTGHFYKWQLSLPGPRTSARIRSLFLATHVPQGQA